LVEEAGYRIVSLFGLLLMMAIAFGLSENKRRLSLRTILWGLGLQLALAMIVLRTKTGAQLFNWAQGTFLKLIDFSNTGASFVFGKLATDPSYGAVVAFQVSTWELFSSW